ncbi:MAG: hypothetical protein HOI95_27465 [Chromatiales bacterium]|jgi:c-di-GMP-binding flagellar brake protein YcgR|nr:hypothetical protein [Chromatiales bacterium]
MTTPTTPDGVDEFVEQVDEPRRINYFLKRLSREHIWLDVRVQGSAERFRTNVLEEQPSMEELLLDELMPRLGQRRLGIKKPLLLGAQFDEALLRFDTHLLAVDIIAGSYINRCARPTNMRYWQRRAERRIVVGYSASIPTEITLSDSEKFRGRLFDISSVGLALAFDRTGAGRVQVPANHGLDQRSGVVRVKIRENETLERECVVRSVRLTDDSALSNVGVRFASMAPPEERQLQGFVMACEREAIRRKRQNQE